MNKSETKRPKSYTTRIQNYEIRDPVYLGLPPKDTPPTYDIVKWFQHDEPQEAIDWRTGELKTIHESCITVGWLKWQQGESEFQFESCGLRWLEENPPEEVRQMVLDFAEKMGKELIENEAD